MLECLRFIFKTIADFCAMLFTIDIGNNLSLGLLFCIVFILLPALYKFITLLTHEFITEADKDIDNISKRRRN